MRYLLKVIFLNCVIFFVGQIFAIQWSIENSIIIYGHRIVKEEFKCILFDSKNEQKLIAQSIYPISIFKEYEDGGIEENVECRFVVIEKQDRKYLFNLESYKVEAEVPKNIRVEFEDDDSHQLVYCDDSKNLEGFYFRIKKKKRDKLYSITNKLSQKNFSKKDFRTLIKSLWFDIFIRDGKFGVLDKKGYVLINSIYERAYISAANSQIFVGIIGDIKYSVNTSSMKISTEKL